MKNVSSDIALQAHLNLAKLLVGCGAQVNVQDKFEQTPLHLAIQHKKWDLVRYLISITTKEYLNIPDKKRRTPLHIACLCCDLGNSMEFTQLLIACGAQVSCQDYHEQTPLHLAIQHKKWDLVRYLISISTKEYVNIPDKEGRTPLHIACFCCDVGNIIEFAQLLVACGAQVNLQDILEQTPLHFAIQHKKWDLVRYLISISTKEYLNIPDKEGRTPLHIASLCCDLGNRMEFAQLLVKNGAQTNIQDYTGQTPIHLATTRKSCYSSDFATFLMRQSNDASDWNIQDWHGRTPLRLAMTKKMFDDYSHEQFPLHLAIQKVKWDLVRYLISVSTKESLNIPDKKGMTSLHIACLCCDLGNKIECAKLLVKNGAQINIQDNTGQTPIHLAIRKSWYSSDLATFLLKHTSNPCDLNIQDRHGRTPLRLAITIKKFDDDEGRIEFVKQIIKMGADINCLDGIALYKQKLIDILKTIEDRQIVINQQIFSFMYRSWITRKLDVNG